MSRKARGVTDANLQGKPAEFAMPNVLVRLSLEHDRMFANQRKRVSENLSGEHGS